MKLKLELPNEQRKAFSLNVMIGELTFAGRKHAFDSRYPDTGSPVNWINPAFADEHKIKWVTSAGMQSWTIGSGDTCTPNGTCLIRFAAGHREHFYVYDRFPADM